MVGKRRKQRRGRGAPPLSKPTPQQSPTKRGLQQISRRPLVKQPVNKRREAQRLTNRASSIPKNVASSATIARGNMRGQPLKPPMPLKPEGQDEAAQPNKLPSAAAVVSMVVRVIVAVAFGSRLALAAAGMHSYIDRAYRVDTGWPYD